MNHLRRIAVLAVLVISAAGYAQERCAAHQRMVENAVPQTVGRAELMEKLLSPTVGRQLTTTFNPNAAAEVFRDRVKADARCGEFRRGDHHFECRYTGQSGSALKVELARGRVTYLNRERSEKKEAITLADVRAVTLARKAAEALGVPMREVSETPDVRAVRVTTATEEGGTIKGESMRTELHVRFQRRIGDVPVAFSRLHAAVDARGDIARMHVRWPDFRLVRGLKPSDAAPREAVVAKVLDDVDRDNRCGSLSRIVANVVYARTALVDGGEGLAGDDGSEKETPSSEFVPALFVTVIPVVQKDDSGVPQMPVQSYVVPLLRGADRADKR